MEPVNRREFFAMAAAVPPLLQASQIKPGKMFVCMHEASSARFDFKPAMEGYAKAGIRAVEPDLTKVRDFVMKESPAVAKRLLDDLGLKAVSSSNQLGLPEPGDARARSLEDLKWKVELARAIGADRLVTPSAGTGMYTEDDYKKGVDNMREAAEIAKPFGVTLMLEFARTSRFAACLPTALKLVREVNHPNYRVMMDTWHFWGGVSKFEDLDLLRDGELHHLHFEDVPAEPIRELQAQPNRQFPGEGIVPLRRIVEVLKRKKYAGAASLEMFNPMIQAMDPYEVAKKARATIEPLIA
ncbi:MAG TPA: sugar phosphate isomerase/epimerase family protein [Terriglobia bacterium]|jgi:2-keto-myo-inositol isomerase|nr:sugar phosphate isomerase/epimerase family protein [Terriglobia bacterium]